MIKLSWNSFDTTTLYANYPYRGDSLILDSTAQVRLDTSLLNADSTILRMPKKSILVEHSLPINNPEPLNRKQLNTDWASAFLIACFVLLAFAKVFYNKRLEQIFFSFFSSRFQNMMERDGHIFKDRISIPLFFVYTISFSLFINQSLWYFFPDFQFPLEKNQLFFLIWVAIMVLGLVKILLMLLYGLIFKSYYIRSEVIVTNFVFNIVFGILLLPILMLAIFIPSSFLLYLGFFFWLFALVYKALRQFIIRNPNTKFSLFNRFVYLCTFEIAPALVIIKLILNELQ